MTEGIVAGTGFAFQSDRAAGFGAVARAHGVLPKWNYIFVHLN